MIAALILTLVSVLFRVATGFAQLDWLMNFSPLAAIALCGAFYLPRRMGMIVPLAALLISDLILNMHYGASLLSVEMLSRYAALAAVSGLGVVLARRPGVAALFGGCVSGSLFFYLVTNTASWIGSAQYAHTLAGWVQALTVGLPGYAPTYSFFRNSLVSDLLFTLLFVVCMQISRVRAGASQNEAAEAVLRA